MALFKLWKQVKAVGQAANEAANRTAVQGPGRRPAPPAQHGMMSGFMNVMAQALEPQMAATAGYRGGPLPGSDPAVVDGSAWTAPLDAGIAGVRARDSAFEPAPLCTFADQVFAACVSVWANAPVSTIRPVMSDDLWEPLAATVGTGKEVPLQDLLRQQTGQARLSGLHAGASYDSAMIGMHVGIPAQFLPPETPPGMGEWEEEWLFQRSVEPGGDPMARPEECPSCGAPTDVDDADHCVHCHQLIPYLTTGWLVTRIVSHNPIAETMHAQMLERVREDPASFQNLPPSMLRLLPPDVQSELARRVPPAP